MAKKIVTLYIRDTSISLLVMRGNQVKKWANLPLDPGLIQEGVVIDEEQDGQDRGAVGPQRHEPRV